MKKRKNTVEKKERQEVENVTCMNGKRTEGQRKNYEI
jgi:hypothetical protein